METHNELQKTLAQYRKDKEEYEEKRKRGCPLPKPEEVDLVIHHDCMDGLGAAWAARKLVGDQAEYIPSTWHDVPPDVSGRHVAVLDMAYDRDVLDRLCAEAASLIVIDHHQTAQKELEGFPNAIFDMSRSGAVLAWWWFHPTDPAKKLKQFEYVRREEDGMIIGRALPHLTPNILLYIEDRDLWKWTMPNSRIVNDAIRAHPWTFEMLDRHAEWLEYQPVRLVDIGNGVQLFKKQLVEEYADGVMLGTLWTDDRWIETPSSQVPEIKIEGQRHPVAVVQSTCRRICSEIGHEIAKRYPDRVAVVWRYVPTMKQLHVELRQDDEKRPFVLSEIAEAFGGGGHRSAAGFTFDGTIHELVTWEQ